MTNRTTIWLKRAARSTSWGAGYPLENLGAKFELLTGMFGYDGHDRRKNPSNPMVRDWRRALQNEWEADKRRREKHREEPQRDRQGGDDCVNGKEGGCDSA
jgi:hypothetical protein